DYRRAAQSGSGFPHGGQSQKERAPGRARGPTARRGLTPGADLHRFETQRPDFIERGLERKVSRERIKDADGNLALGIGIGLYFFGLPRDSSGGIETGMVKARSGSCLPR